MLFLFVGVDDGTGNVTAIVFYIIASVSVIAYCPINSSGCCCSWTVFVVIIVRIKKT